MCDKKKQKKNKSKQNNGRIKINPISPFGFGQNERLQLTARLMAVGSIWPRRLCSWMSCKLIIAWIKIRKLIPRYFSLRVRGLFSLAALTAPAAIGAAL